MKTILIFIPSRFYKEQPGRMFGKIVYDNVNDVKKFYIIGMQRELSVKHKNDFIGYFSGTDVKNVHLDKERSDWINLYLHPKEHTQEINYDYCLKNITINNKQISLITCHVMVIIYDQLSLYKSEIFVSSTTKDHFYQLKNILEEKMTQDDINRKTCFGLCKETMLTKFALVFLYPIIFLCSVTNMLLPILKYSTLGLHLNGWLENLKWMLNSIIERRKITIKTGNHILSIAIDVLFGVLMLRFLLVSINNAAPSLILLDNAEVKHFINVYLIMCICFITKFCIIFQKVVESLKGLVNWLMGSPAGLKLNHNFNGVLGKFFLYHIHLWWTFLVVLKPILDFAFEVLLLFGRLGITFQISIVADLLALVSFHSYCIYVYAAR